MAKLTRRGFIRKTSIGAATVGALTTVPGLASAHAAQAIEGSALSTARLDEPLAAFVRDSATGEVAVMVGTREIIVHDPELVRRLARAAR